MHHDICITKTQLERRRKKSKDNNNCFNVGLILIQRITHHRAASVHSLLYATISMEIEQFNLFASNNKKCELFTYDQTFFFFRISVIVNEFDEISIFQISILNN